MNINSLYYFSELAKSLNMTKTAERLFISQQTLSNHIQRLEQYYDTTLFNRKPALSLTPAGAAVLDFAERVLAANTNLKAQLVELENRGMGVLRFGASVSRGKQFLPHIIPEFMRQFPNVRICYEDHHSPQLESLLLDGKLDLAIVMATQPESAQLVYNPFFKDWTYFCVTDRLLEGCFSAGEIRAMKEEAENGGIELMDIRRLPMAITSNRMGEMVLNFFKQEQFSPSITFSGTYSTHTLPLCSAGLTATFCGHLGLLENSHLLGGDVNIFPLLYNGSRVYQQLSLTWHKHRHLPVYSQAFLEILTNSAEKMEQHNITRVIGAAESGE